MLLDSFGALRTLKTHYVCGLCDVSGDTDLDDFIEVTFTVSPQLRRLPFHDPDSLSVEDFHWKLRFLERRANPRANRSGFSTFCTDWFAAWRSCRRASTTTLRADLGPGALSGVNVRRRPH